VHATSHSTHVIELALGIESIKCGGGSPLLGGVGARQQVLGHMATREHVSRGVGVEAWQWVPVHMAAREAASWGARAGAWQRVPGHVAARESTTW
jgi:hypothetical protein